MRIKSDYSYISDPPIFADIGDATILFDKVSLSSTVKSHLTEDSDEDVFSIEISEVQMNYTASPFVEFDGISDFSEVATNMVNTVSATLRNRIRSLVNGGKAYPIDGKIEDVINNILALFP